MPSKLPEANRVSKSTEQEIHLLKNFSDVCINKCLPIQNI